MLKRIVVVVLACTGWGLGAADVLLLLPELNDDAIARLGMAVGLIATLQLMLWARMRPLDVAYRMGCRDERKRVIKHMNQAPAPLLLASNDWDR